ncbi:transcription termination/antitermination NusG family protein [Botrimarina sp.]|uniref:transcription termination/antitermination protein NusG n=1 Tax=Botrimarina sp. TaxID=2795802 RepID=UPI0032EC0FC7
MAAIGDAAPCGHSSWADAPLAAVVRRYLYPAGLLDDGVAAGPVDDGALWWMVYTKSRQEKRLSQQLREMGVPHYLPVHTREAATRGRVRVVEEPLFAGYLFLCCDDDQRREALSTNRISSTTPVAEAGRLRYELAQVARSIAAGASLTLESKLEPGDWVRVRSGLYAGLEGMVLRRHSRTNLLLSVNFLKQGASLELPDCFLEPIDPPEFDEPPAVEIVGRRGL